MTGQFTQRLADLKLLTNSSYTQAMWDRQRGLDKLKTEVEDAYDNLDLTDEEYWPLLQAIKEAY